MSDKFKNNLVNYSIYIILAFIIISSLLSFWNRYVTYDTKSVIDQSSRVNGLLYRIKYEVIAEMEKGVNVYAITKNEQDLFPYQKAKQKNDSIFSELDKELINQGFSGNQTIELRKCIKNYDEILQKIIQAVPQDSTHRIVEFFKEKQGDLIQQQYQTLTYSIYGFENELQKQAQYDYVWSIDDNAIIQIILIILSVPILVITSLKLKSEVKNRLSLLTELEESNRKYLFEDGTEMTITAKDVVERSINNLKKAFSFVEEISKGKFETAQSNFEDSDRKRNQHTLMGALIRMGEQLHKLDEEDNKRNWIAEGLNQFGEITRKYQHNPKDFGEKATSFLTKYLNSQQGSLFVHCVENGEEYLEMAALYAFDRKKWLEKRIEIGSGLIGQVFLEKEYIILNRIPNGYISITSGLGDATPSCLLIVPMKYNDEVEAIFEIARFTKYLPHEIDFLQKAGESLASTLQTVNNTQRNEKLLKQSQLQSEMLKVQEEELRQNMEEMQATQEEMYRKEKELNNRLTQVSSLAPLIQKSI